MGGPNDSKTIRKRETLLKWLQTAEALWLRSNSEWNIFKFINFYELPAFSHWTIQSQKFRKKLITYINHFIQSLINYNFTIYKLNWSHQQFLQTNFLIGNNHLVFLYSNERSWYRQLQGYRLFLTQVDLCQFLWRRTDMALPNCLIRFILLIRMISAFFV